MIKAERLNQIRSSEKSRDFKDFIDYIARKYQNSPAFIIKHKAGREVSYETKSYIDFRSDVLALGAAFMERAWEKKRIAVIGDNKYQWILTYMSTLAIGGIIVPLDKGLAYSEFESSVLRSGADIIVYDQSHASLIEELQACGSFNAVAYIAMDSGLEGHKLIADFTAQGEALLNSGKDRLSQVNIDPHAMSILLFTSGTTSLAKAVMLSHDNILSNLYDMDLVEDIRSTDTNMAFLPYHHTFGSTGQLVMLNCGAKTAYCDGLKYIQKNLVEYQISIFVCVPLLIESIYKKVIKTARKNGLEGKLKFGKKLSDFLMFFHIDMRRKIFKSVLDQLGGQLRLVISGAASIEPETLEGFKSFGIEAINGYGLTESSPVLSAENCEYQRNGSIGKAMPSVDIRIEEPNEEGVGELIAKGPNIMLGYYENEEETSKTLIDGWLHTGDLARIDRDGYIFICGRKKNVIVLKNGKNVFPEEIELLISQLEYVQEVFVFALPKEHNEKDLALYVKLVYDKASFEDGMSEEQIHEKISKDIKKINDTLPNYKQIHNIITTTEPMIKTTTNKVKRFEEIKVIKEALGM